MSLPRVLVGGALAATVAIACRSESWSPPAPIFPASAPAIVLPLRDPLLHADLSVELSVAGSGTARPIWAIVDSGMTTLVLPAAYLRGRGIRPLSGVEISGLDALGRPLPEEVALAQSVQLGALEVRDVLVALSKDLAVLGESILAHAAWELDFDRGTLTLGAAPSVDAAPAVSVPLRHLDRGNADLVTLRVNGQPIEMLLDTGAIHSAIPEDLGRRAGLSVEDWHAGGSLRSAGGTAEVRHAFSADASLGEIDLGRRTFLVLPGGSGAYGLLGLDVLMRYRVSVDPGKTLSLRPRGDLRATATGRVARWPWLPTCSVAGCVRARLEPEDDGARLTLDVLAPLPRGVSVVLACADGAPAELRAAPELLGAGHFAGGVHHVVARVGSGGVPGAPVGVRLPLGRLWFSRGGEGCRELEVLDLVPPSEGDDGATTVASWWP